MATTRIYNVRPTSDGSGAIVASIELLQDDGAPSGLRSEVRLSAAQCAELLALYQAQGLPALQARLLAIAGEIDSRFTAEAVAAYLAGNAASADIVSRIMAHLEFPLDVAVR